MTAARDELDYLLSRSQTRGIFSPTITMDELMRAYSRLPLNSDDCQQIVDCFAIRMRAGRHLSAMPLEEGMDSISQEAKRAFVERVTPQGIAFVTALDIGVSLLILKTNAGKGLFGGQKVSFTCFASEASDGFQQAGVVPTIQRAFGILDSLYGIVEHIEQALD